MEYISSRRHLDLVWYNIKKDVFRFRYNIRIQHELCIFQQWKMMKAGDERLIFIFKFQTRYNNNTYERIVLCARESCSQFLWNEKYSVPSVSCRRERCLSYCTFLKNSIRGTRRINTFPNITRGTKKYFRSISHCIFRIYESSVSMERYPSIEMGRGSISRVDCLYSRRRKEFQRAFNASCEKNEIISYHVRGGSRAITRSKSYCAPFGTGMNLPQRHSIRLN